MKPRTRSSSSTKPRLKPSAPSFSLYLELQVLQQAGCRTRPSPHSHQAAQDQSRQIQWRHSLHLRSPRLLSQKPHLSRGDASRRQMVQRRTGSHRRPARLTSTRSNSLLKTNCVTGRRQNDPKAAPCWRANCSTTGAITHEPELFQQERRAISVLRQVGIAARPERASAGSVGRIAAAEIENAVRVGPGSSPTKEASRWRTPPSLEQDRTVVVIARGQLTYNGRLVPPMTTLSPGRSELPGPSTAKDPAAAVGSNT